MAFSRGQLMVQLALKKSVPKYQNDEETVHSKVSTWLNCLNSSKETEMGFEEFSSDAGDDSCKDPDYISESMISSSPGSCDSRSKSIILEQQDEQFSSKGFDRYRSEPDLTNFLDNCQRSSQQIPDEHQAYPCRQLLSSDSSGVHENTVGGASEHAGPSANDSQTHCSAKSQKQRPKRLCKFCNTWNLHLTRHLKRKHKNEEEVELALKLPKKEQERAFGGECLKPIWQIGNLIKMPVL